MTDLFDYNTQSKKLIISEYGRSLQNFVEFICKIEDKDKRTKMAEALISVMEILNPTAKEQSDYKHKFWDHLHMVSDFKLDVNSPYPIPERNELVQKPEKISYPSLPIKFRFYGRNLQYMLNKATNIENPEMKSEFVNLLASFMSNSSRNWNNENLTNEQLTDHISSITNNKLAIKPEELEITFEQKTANKKKFFKPNNKFFKKKNKNNYK